MGLNKHLFSNFYEKLILLVYLYFYFLKLFFLINIFSFIVESLSLSSSEFYLFIEFSSLILFGRKFNSNLFFVPSNMVACFLSFIPSLNLACKFINRPRLQFSANYLFFILAPLILIAALFLQ